MERTAHQKGLDDRNKIEIDDVSYQYQDNNTLHQALDSIQLTIEDGEFVCIVGHSGCGKSTLLSLLAGLAKPSSGSIRIEGEKVNGPSTSRAMVFQHYSLFPWMTALKNVAFSILHSRKNLTKSEATQSALEYLRRVEMEDACDKYPFQLSGGMQQRVAIARALAMESDILLLDEPFGALDARNRTALQGLLSSLWSESEEKKTVVFVTHDLTEAVLLADRIVFMRPQRIEKIIPVSLPRPRILEELTGTREYQELYDELTTLFYLDEDDEGEDGFYEE